MPNHLDSLEGGPVLLENSLGHHLAGYSVGPKDIDEYLEIKVGGQVRELVLFL
jgi:hypothetical protein